MEIRALHQGDDRRDFSSGDLDLDRFFRLYAGQNQFRHHLGVTYVAVEGSEILGYVTVAAGQLEFDDLPNEVREKLPRYPLPILRLARLAVASRVAGRGIGRRLLRFVLELALQMAGEFGCTGVVVDAKPNAVAFYRRYGFVSMIVVEGGSDARPQPVALFRSIRAIREGAGPLT